MKQARVIIWLILSNAYKISVFFLSICNVCLDFIFVIQRFIGKMLHYLVTIFVHIALSNREIYIMNNMRLCLEKL